MRRWRPSDGARAAAPWLLLANLLIAFALYGQQTQTGLQPGSTGSGMASGGAHAPIRDALHRPITAGGFVDGAPVVFSDATIPSGLAKFHHRSGTPEKSAILDAPGSGVALIDYDNDGWLDIYLLNGSTVAAF